jgi:hypothetical protein
MGMMAVPPPQSHRRPKGHDAWVVVTLASVAGVVVAGTSLEATVQTAVLFGCAIAGLFAVARLLEGEEFRRIERGAPSTFDFSPMPAPRFFSWVGAVHPTTPPAGPVNTARQDEIDALNRAWRASPDEVV